MRSDIKRSKNGLWLGAMECESLLTIEDAQPRSKRLYTDEELVALIMRLRGRKDDGVVGPRAVAISDGRSVSSAVARPRSEDTYEEPVVSVEPHQKTGKRRQGLLPRLHA